MQGGLDTLQVYYRIYSIILGKMTFYCRTYYVRATCCGPLVLSPPRVLHKNFSGVVL